MPAVRFVDVVLEGFFDLRRQVDDRPVVPQRLSRGDDPGGELVERRNDVRPVLDGVLARDRDDPALPALLHRHADAVARDQPPTLVGDDVGALFQVQRLVRRAGERVGLLPQRLAIAEHAELLAPQPLAGDVAHLLQEPQVTPLGFRCRVGPLEDLDQPVLLLVVLQCPQDQQVLGRVAFAVAVGGARIRRDQQRLTGVGDPLDQFRVADAVLGVVVQHRRGGVDVILQLQLAVFVQQPHRPAGGG